MKKESTYYFLLVSFIVALLTTNAYSLQFDSIHDRTFQKELVDVENGELNISVVFELDPNETSTHLLAPNDINTFLQEIHFSTTENPRVKHNPDFFHKVRRRNLINSYFSSYLSDRV